ncbi:MAG: S8 family peptidase, partial [Saprospiraceae bacterium]|nr:S8 family peptidase [Saprospiraceae bacterium]
PVTVDGSNRFKPNVSAPGVNVRSSIPGGSYANFSGTSMAGPHVAGMVALIISANPELAGQVDVIEQIIEETAVPKTTDQECGGIPGTQVPNHTYGHGRVDALAAVEAAIALIPPPPSATAEQLPMNVRVFPNPVSNKLNISVENAEGSLGLELFDMSGRALHQQQWAANGQVFISIEMSKFHSGIYFYRLTSQGRVVQGKVVKA